MPEQVDREGLIALIKSGPEPFRTYVSSQYPKVVDLSGANLTKFQLQNFNFSGVVLAEADLQGSSLHEAKLETAQFPLARMRGTDLTLAEAEYASFQEADLSFSNLTRIKGRNCNLNRTDLTEAMLTEADLSGAMLRSAKCVRTVMYRANLSGADLKGSDFAGANLEWSNLSEADLRGANLHGAKLANANVKGAKISRLAIEDLRAEDLAGLKPSQLHEMDIQDGFAELRNYFSGFWAFIHVLSIVIWLAPMLWIAIRSLILDLSPSIIESRLVRLTLFEQLWGYCKSGASAPTRVASVVYYPANSFFLATWILILGYNVSRFVFVAKVKLLELKQAVTGLHPDFALEGFPRRAFQGVQVFFYVNLLLVLWHFGKFLATKFPVYPN